MKVLMVGPARSVNGGVSAVVNNYYDAGLDSKVELEYIDSMEDGSKWHKLLVAVKAVFSFIRKINRNDIVHIHMASDVSIYRKLPFIWLTKLWKKKLIIHQHGGNIHNFYYEVCGNIRRAFIRKSLQQADRFLVVAPYLKDIFSTIIGADKILVVPNAIMVPEQYQKDYDCEKLIFLGRLCREKGIAELLDAVAILKKKFLNLELYLAGVWCDDSLRQKANSMKKYVHQLGWIDNKKRECYLKQCNIFVLPTYFEGLPMSLLEGMAYSCACVATEVGGIPQVMENGKEGVLIPAQNVNALVDAISNLLENKKLQQRLGNNAKKLVREQYNVDKMVNILLSIYERA